MATKKQQGTAPKMSDTAVKKATGKTWAQWFTILDKAGARKLDHKGIVAVLTGRHRVGPWWRQMVTVGYEQARGMRVVHQTAGGFSISRSRTLPVPVASLYKSWKDTASRRRWLKDHQFTVRTAAANKSMRITWIDGRTSVEVNFYAKGATKSQVAVQHSKLPDAKAATKMKAYWSGQLDRLVAMLEA